MNHAMAVANLKSRLRVTEDHMRHHRERLVFHEEQLRALDLQHKGIEVAIAVVTEVAVEGRIVDEDHRG